MPSVRRCWQHHVRCQHTVAVNTLPLSTRRRCQCQYDADPTVNMTLLRRHRALHTCKRTARASTSLELLFPGRRGCGREKTSAQFRHVEAPDDCMKPAIESRWSAIVVKALQEQQLMTMAAPRTRTKASTARPTSCQRGETRTFLRGCGPVKLGLPDGGDVWAGCSYGQDVWALDRQQAVRREGVTRKDDNDKEADGGQERKAAVCSRWAVDDMQQVGV